MVRTHVRSLAALGAATKLVRDIRPGPDPSYPWGLTVVGGLLYFVADDGVHGSQRAARAAAACPTRSLAR